MGMAIVTYRLDLITTVGGERMRLAAHIPKMDSSGAEAPITAIITGFGSFRHYQVNPSWLAVRALPSRVSTDTGPDVNIETYQLPVQYQLAREIIGDMHTRMKPDIVIHCGVSSRPCYCLEKRAYSEGYVEPDNIGETPTNDSLQVASEMYQVEEGLLKSLVDYLTSDEPPPVPICISDNAGRFLCEYSLFQSLKNAPVGRICLFLHVPADVSVHHSTRILYRTVMFLARARF